MNDFMYDPMAVRQQPVDPMAVRQQPMPVPGTPVYNNPMAMNAANAIYGSPQMRQQSVMMTEAQENAFGPGSEVYESGNTKIYEGLKAKE